jgi:hypothetical protein
LEEHAINASAARMGAAAENYALCGKSSRGFWRLCPVFYWVLCGHVGLHIGLFSVDLCLCDVRRLFKETEKKYEKTWLLLGGVMVFSVAVLGWIGIEIYQQAPPTPDQVVTTSGKVLLTKDDIQNGQNVWQGDGRDAGRVDLGARQLCRSGLERRVPAPRVGLYSGRYVAD